MPKPRIKDSLPPIDWTKRLDDPRMLDIYEVAEIWQMSFQGVQRQVVEGRFPVMPRQGSQGVRMLWSTFDIKNYLTTPPPKRGGVR